MDMQPLFKLIDIAKNSTDHETEVSIFYMICLLNTTMN